MGIIFKIVLSPGREGWVKGHLPGDETINLFVGRQVPMIISMGWIILFYRRLDF
jgi:hypothetical protein